MFEHKYRNAMDKTAVNEDVLNHAINNATAKPKSVNALKIALIACLSAAVICTSVFVGFKISKNHSAPETDFKSNDILSDNAFDDTNENNKIPPSLTEHGFCYAEDHDKLIEHLKNGVPQDDIAYPEDPDDLPDSDSPSDDISNTITEANDENCGLIKTDGTLIYILQPNQRLVTVVSENNGKAEIVADIQINDSMSPKKILLVNETLAVIGTKSNETMCLFYDISDVNNPKIIGKSSQSGNFYNCISVDGKVYLFTTMSTKGTAIPLVNGTEINYRNVIIAGNKTNSFSIITAYDTAKKTTLSALAVLGENANIYCSGSSVYLSYSIVNSKEPAPDLASAKPQKSTKILKISLNDGMLKAVAAGQVDGVINKSTSMNEKENVFTIIPTIELSFKNKRSNGTERVVLKTFNRVYCLNEDLITIGTSEDFATNKNTREINFVGNIAYLRTLSTKDPCYAVDLNDPHHPKIIPELEQLSQFTYLHIYGNGAVLGFNQDLNSKTGKVTGLEISVYDVSSDNYSTGITTWSHVWEPGEYINETSRYNEEGLILDAQNGLIGIPLSDLMYDEVSNIWTLDVEYKMFHYQNNTISESGSINFTINDIRADMRLIRTDNYLHLISDTRLLTISPTDYSVVNEIVF